MRGGFDQPGWQHRMLPAGKDCVVLCGVHLVAEENHESAAVAGELPQSFAELLGQSGNVDHHHEVVIAGFFPEQIRCVDMSDLDRGALFNVFETQCADGVECAARFIGGVFGKIAVDAQNPDGRADPGDRVTLVIIG